MNLPELCIRRPVMTTLLTVAICLFGAMAYRVLPVSDLPNVDFPTVVVNASLPGANQVRLDEHPVGRSLEGQALFSFGGRAFWLTLSSGFTVELGCSSWTSRLQASPPRRSKAFFGSSGT